MSSPNMPGCDRMESRPAAIVLDPIGGISGDMFIGALLDLGVDFHQLEHELEKLNLDEYHLHSARKQKANIEALEEQVTRGQFSMTLQASWKDGELVVDAVQRGLVRLAQALQMEIRLRFTHPQRRQRLAILVTREAHCFEGLMRAARAGHHTAASAALVP